jgi:WD40 repeat protein
VTHFGPIRDVAVSAAGKLAYAAAMNLIYVWELEKRQLAHKILNPQKSGKWDFLTVGRLPASSMEDGSLVFWDRANGNEMDRREGFGQIIGMDPSPDGKTPAVVRITAVGKGRNEIILTTEAKDALVELAKATPILRRRQQAQDAVARLEKS